MQNQKYTQEQNISLALDFSRNFSRSPSLSHSPPCSKSSTNYLISW